MKLSEKGLKKIQRWQDAKRLGHAYPVDEIEFELDDFESPHPFLEKQGIESEKGKTSHHVVLTVEEACEILDYLSYLHLRGGRDSFLKELEKCNRNLYERIEQAEGRKNDNAT